MNNTLLDAYGNDPKYKALATQQQADVTASQNTYTDLINQNKQQTTEQNNWLDTWQNQQNDLINKQTQFNIGVQEQNKAQAEQGFTKEATASDTAYQKAINPYGQNAEQRMANGLAGGGYSETAKMMAYGVSQNRTATARSSMISAKTEFDNAIAQARLTGDTNMAEIALQTMQQKIANIQREYETTSDLTQKNLANTQDINNTYWGRAQDTYSNMFADKQAKQEQANWQKEFNLSKSTSGSGSGGYGYDLGGGTGTTAVNNGMPKSTQQYGVFSNGYQPAGISGYGKLTKTGDTFKVGDQTRTIWKTPDGNKWTWDGKTRTYKKFVAPKQSNSKGGKGAIGSSSGGGFNDAKQTPYKAPTVFKKTTNPLVKK